MNNICLYKVLCGIKNIKMTCQDSLILVANSKTCFYLRSSPEGYLLLTEIKDFNQLVKTWLSESPLQVHSDSSSTISTSLKEILSFSPETCIITKHNPEQHSLAITWLKSSGFSSQEPVTALAFNSLSLESDLQSLRQTIDNSLIPEGLKLRGFRALFKLNQFQHLFCGITFYKYLTGKSLVRLKRSSNLVLNILSPTSSYIAAKTTACSPVHLVSPSSSSLKTPAATDLIDARISEIMKDDEAVKYINYKGWAQKAGSGQRLLPNEQAFAKKLASFGKRKVKTDNAKELKNLSTKMIINLDENRSKRQLQEAIKQSYLNDILFKSVKFSIPPKPKKPKDPKPSLKVNVEDQVNKAVALFDKMQKSAKKSLNEL